eukprot:COSAG05_NODE_582_length_8540_cov_26.722782_3_plen_461_part_00
MAEAAKEAMVAARSSLQAGDSAAAKALLESAASAAQAAAARCVSLGEPPMHALEVQGEAHVALAELLWQQGTRQEAVQSYEAALKIARDQGDSQREGMISLGMGYALLNSGDENDLPGAVAAMRRSRDLAAEAGHTAQVGFVYAMLEQAEQRLREVRESAAPSRSEEEEQAEMLRSFVRSLISRAPVMLFMKGSALDPQCGFSLSAARALMKLEIDFDAVDVQQDTRLRDAVKSFSEWPTFPQLWAGSQLIGGSDIIDELESEGTLLAEVAAQLHKSAEAGRLPPPMDGKPDDRIDGIVPRKIWPAMSGLANVGCSSKGSAHGCHHDRGDECTSGGHACNKNNHAHGQAGCDGGRWLLRVMRRPQQLGYGDYLETDVRPWVLELTAPKAAAACSDVHGHEHDDGHLSDEARAWMAAHPDQKLPLHLCPTHGDCGTCPERHDCKWHDTGGAAGENDIEDYK